MQKGSFFSKSKLLKKGKQKNLEKNRIKCEHVSHNPTLHHIETVLWRFTSSKPRANPIEEGYKSFQFLNYFCVTMINDMVKML